LQNDLFWPSVNTIHTDISKMSSICFQIDRSISSRNHLKILEEEIAFKFEGCS
jgi:hypothetical protein